MSSGAPRINYRETYIPRHSMFSFSTSLAIALTVVSFSGGAAAVSCGVCSPTIFYSGLTRNLTLTREEGSNTVQCNYDTPPISGFSPGCLYRVPFVNSSNMETIFTSPQNVDGALIFTNTGPTLTSLPGACPSITLVTKTSC
ncbi:hypothetical protein DFH09DRAFT_1147240 [Mycena vulgaris]|nr:hypothetical protein DFH09DRAFT_1147240 [Mycena vulgaris]